jgi:hypothetical protein
LTKQGSQNDAVRVAASGRIASAAIVPAAVAVLVLAAWSPPADAARAPSTAPRGNAAGLALLARVEKAYRRVPAVVMNGDAGSLHVRFTLLLRRGVAVAEEFAGGAGSGTTTLVRRGSGPTWVRDPGATCWRSVARHASQDLDDVGLPFPDTSGGIVGRPTRRGSLWLLPLRSKDGGSYSIHIAARNLHIVAETGLTSGRRFTELVLTLTRRPPLPVPRPTC